MRELVLGMFVSLDGFVSGPKGEIDWVFRSGDDATDEWIVGNLRQAGLLAMGRRSFEEMRGYWPTAETPFAAPMNEVPKAVFTRTGLGGAAGEGSWDSPIVAQGELAEEVTRLKAQPGKEIRVLGGARLARDLAAQGLVDEYRLMVCPVALGQGVPLFGGLPGPLDLRLVSARTFDGGAMALVYRPAGREAAA